MLEFYYRPAENVVSRLVVEEAVLVRLPDGEMTVLNESGSLLWALADGSRTETELAEALQAAYALPDTPRVAAFLADLTARALLAHTDKPNPLPEASRSATPTITNYDPPAVRVSELLETLAGSCPSAFDGQPATGDCRSDWFTCDCVTGA